MRALVGGPTRLNVLQAKKLCLPAIESKTRYGQAHENDTTNRLDDEGGQMVQP